MQLIKLTEDQLRNICEPMNFQRSENYRLGGDAWVVGVAEQSREAVCLKAVPEDLG